MKTWLEIYYPECADETKRINAIRHSLRKWIGLKEENLRRFNVGLSEVDYYPYVFAKGADPESRIIILEIDSESCALCFWYYKERFSIINGENPCSACPLFDPVNEKSCADSGGPYHAFAAETRDPSDMIKALRKILLEQLREEREKK